MHRPFIWKNEVYLGHWIGFLPAQERMAVARLDMEAGVVRYMYRFSHLPDDIERAQYPDVPQVTPGWKGATGKTHLS